MVTSQQSHTSCSVEQRRWDFLWVAWRDAVRPLHTIALHDGKLQRCIHHGTTMLESAFNVECIR
jgi:hypothetical protein